MYLPIWKSPNDRIQMTKRNQTAAHAEGLLFPMGTKIPPKIPFAWPMVSRKKKAKTVGRPKPAAEKTSKSKKNTNTGSSDRNKDTICIHIPHLQKALLRYPSLVQPKLHVHEKMDHIHP